MARSWLMLQGPLRASIILPFATFILGALVILMTLVEGQRQGLDYHYSKVVDGEQSAITIAISDLVYGLNAGYLGYSSVKHKLVEAWPPGEDKARNEVRLDHEAIKARQNAAIQAAATMEAPKRAYLSDRSLMTMVYDDIGYVDFVKLSFRLFGMKMEAMHYTYFVLLSISAVIFLVTFRADVLAQTFLLATLFAYYIEIHFGFFNLTPTSNGMRHGSTLGLLPMWYLAFLVFRRQPVKLSLRRLSSLGISLPWTDWKSLVLLASTIVQLAILLLAIKMRGSAIFMIYFVVALAVVLAIAPLWKQRLRTWPVATLARRAAQWPVVMLLGGLFANSQMVNASLHPIYFTDDVIPHHGLWHSAILGFSYSPELVPKRAAEAFRTNFDAAGYYIVEDYLGRIRFMEKPADPNQLIPSYISPWTNTVKFRLHDNIARRAFFDIAASHPWEMVVLYFYKKPIALVRETFVQMAISPPDLLWLALIALGGMVSACFWWLWGAREMSLLEPLMLAVAPMPFAALPSMWAYSYITSMADYYLLLWLLGQIAVSALIVFAARQIRGWYGQKEREGPVQQRSR
jgi:hypothetical protein